MEWLQFLVVWEESFYRIEEPRLPEFLVSEKGSFLPGR